MTTPDRFRSPLLTGFRLATVALASLSSAQFEKSSVALAIAAETAAFCSSLSRFQVRLPA